MNSFKEMENNMDEMLMNWNPDFLDPEKGIRNWEYAKERVVPMLVNEHSAEPSESIVSREYLGMKVIYFLDFKVEDMNFFALVKVSNELLDLWDVTIDELDKVAKQNLLEKGYFCKEMASVLRDFMCDEELINSMEEAIAANRDKTKMYVLSREDNRYGAALIMLPEVRERIGEIVKSDRYVVLPSSRHELIVIPENDDTDYEFLKGIVKSVNDLEVPADDLLSYDVFVCRDSELSRVA